MRLIILLTGCFAVQSVSAQAYNQRDTCTWTELLVTSAANSFKDTKSQKLLKSYQLNEAGSVKFVEEFENTLWYWPGTSTNYIEIITQPATKTQTISLVSPFSAVDTKEKAYAQLKRLFKQVTNCTIIPFKGQPVALKGLLPSIDKAMLGTRIMEREFQTAEGKRRVLIWLGVKLKDQKYHAEMQVTLVQKKIALAPVPCRYIQEITDELKTNFSSIRGKQTSYDDNLINDVFSESRLYETTKGFPGSDGCKIENGTMKIKSKNSLIAETWAFKAWYWADTYEEALKKWKELYAQINGCEIITPQGRKIKLTGVYKDPRKDKDEDFIDFATHTKEESFFISIKFRKDKDGYIFWLSISTVT